MQEIKGGLSYNIFLSHISGPVGKNEKTSNPCSQVASLDYDLFAFQGHYSISLSYSLAFCYH